MWSEFRDFKTQSLMDLPNLGKEIPHSTDVFVEGDFLDAVGTSKGHGFQGVVKASRL